MTIDSSSRLRDVAAGVGAAPEEYGIRAVLTGGACATIYSNGRYQSADLDFILVARTTQKRLDEAMISVGFGGGEIATFIRGPGSTSSSREARWRSAPTRGWWTSS